LTERSLDAMAVRQIEAAIDALRAMDLAAPERARVAALAALEAAIHEQNVFLHAVAHDLRNPLTAILGQVQLLQRSARKADGAGVDAERVLRTAVGIEASVSRMATLIDSVLDTGWEVGAGRMDELGAGGVERSAS